MTEVGDTLRDLTSEGEHKLLINKGFIFLLIRSFSFRNGVERDNSGRHKLAEFTLCRLPLVMQLGTAKPYDILHPDQRND